MHIDDDFYLTVSDYLFSEVGEVDFLPSPSGSKQSDIPLDTGCHFSSDSQLIDDFKLLAHPFVTPDGSPVAYSLPGEKFLRRNNGPRLLLHKSYRNPHNGKWCHLKLHLRTETWQRQYYVVLDFDKDLGKEHDRWLNVVGIERNKGLGQTQWHDLRAGWKTWGEHLQRVLGDKGYVIESRSHKVKVIICLEYDQPVKHPKRRDAIAVFKTLLPTIVTDERIAEGVIDCSMNGLFTTYVLSHDILRLAEAMRHLRPVRVLQNDTETAKEIASVTVTPEAAALAPQPYTYGGVDVLPDTLAGYGFRGAKEQMVRILCAMPALLKRDGFDISQPIMARSLGITQPTVCNHLVHLRRIGFLTVKSHRFCPGSKAKTYVAAGPLRAAMKLLYRNRTQGSLPKSIADGQWHETLLRFRIGVFRHRPEKFLPWVHTLPGANDPDKDRIYQAKKIHEWCSKRESST